MLLCDGLHTLNIETKAFSLLFITLAVIPVRNRALILFGLRPELVEAADEQWKIIKQMHSTKVGLLDRVHGYRSFLIASDDFSKIIEFGDNTHADSTTLVEKIKNYSCLEFNKKRLIAIYDSALKKELDHLIESSLVKHPSCYYLIEGKYYTETFYEVGNLVSDRLGREIALNDFRILLSNCEIGSIFTISEPLYAFSEYLSKIVPNVNCYKRNADMERTSFMEAITRKVKGTKILLLTDVICSASEIQKFLSMVPNLDEIVVGCFVDGRDEKLTYLTVKREEKAHSVPVISIKKHLIKPIYDLPPDTDYSKVLIIDKRTHTPTPYDYVEMPTLLPDQLIDKSIENEALYCGHFKFHEKHYSAFLYFARLFKGIQLELENWWDKILSKQQLQGNKNEDITVFYLDEQRGWETLIDQHLV